MSESVPLPSAPSEGVAPHGVAAPPPPPSGPPDNAPSEAETYFQAYSEYSNTLRTWLVAYGVGGPVLIASQSSLASLAKSGDLRVIGFLFLTGVFVQAALAALNKAIMWSLYYGEVEKPFQSHWIYKACDWLSERLWIDLVIDWSSIALFVVATWRVFQALTYN